MRHRADIEGLRAVAVLPVVFFHLGLGIFSGGYVGVDIFFVISGFLISGVIAEDIARQRFSIANFYNRRIKRIFPALYAMVFVCICFSFIFLPRDLANFGNSIISLGLFSSNAFFWWTTGYFDAPSQTKPLLHTWSLSVEEQFYVFYPLLLFALRRHSNMLVMAVIAGLAVVSLGLCIWLTPNHPSAAFYLPYTRAWELLAGAFVSRMTLSLGPMSRNGVASIGLLAVLGAIFLFHPDTPFPGWAALIPVLGAALLIAAGPETAIARLLSLRPAGFIGQISYSLYLWHWPVIVFVRYYYVTLPGWMVATLCVSLSFALAIASYYVVEQPIRTRKFSVRTVLASGVAVSLLFMGLGMIGRVAQGFPGRFPDYDQFAEDPASYHRKVCFLEDTQSFSEWQPKACSFPSTAGPGPAIVLWGDSYAAHLTPGFLSLQKQHAFSLVEMAMTGCPPVLDYDEPGRVNCGSFNTSALAWIESHPPDLLVIAARWNRYRDFSLVRDKLDSTMAVLAARKTKVLIVGESPFYGDPVPQIRAVLHQRGIDNSWFAPENSFLADGPLQAVASKYGAQFYAPRTALCHEAKCMIAIDGQPVHWDQGHLSELGSRRVVETMAPMLPLSP